jgi:uncharacterized membrane protein
MSSEFPNWDKSATCRSDVHRYRISLLREALLAERGTIDSLDASVLARMERKEVVARNVGPEEDRQLGARLADSVAKFGGSWAFLGLFGSVIVLWMLTNILVLTRAFDPYPFILLNLVLSCLAAVQAPIIMMSQNRHSAQDRVRAEHDYEVNLKAELEVQLLHEKLDHLMLRDWHQLLEILGIQTEMLEELGSSGNGEDSGDD